MNTEGTILDLVVKNKQVIYGARATNYNLPLHLRKKTDDYDILTSKAEDSAKELANALNKKFGKERFKVIPAKHSKTFKVKDSDTNKTVVDYTKTTKKPNSHNELGVRYANLNYSEKKIKRIVKDESSSFRHDKDVETLKRIKEGSCKRCWT